MNFYTKKNDALVLRNPVVQKSTNLTSWNLKKKKVTYYSHILTVDMMVRDFFFTFFVLEKKHMHIFYQLDLYVTMLNFCSRGIQLQQPGLTG